MTFVRTIITEYFLEAWPFAKESLKPKGSGWGGPSSLESVYSISMMSSFLPNRSHVKTVQVLKRLRQAPSVWLADSPESQISELQTNVICLQKQSDGLIEEVM